ncbi:MAG: DUF3500 domain-containing protein [Chthoniobacter sp.]|nr:DUF3500 domain-containing protein [Chthoniobacter sp.]
MNPNQNPALCPDCDAPRIHVLGERPLDRRAFLRTSAAAVAASVAPWARAAEPPKSETLVAQLYKSLTEEQRKAVCFGFADPKRKLVDNNWQIVPQTVGGFFDKDQQALIADIFTGLHSPEYAERVMAQVAHDSGKAGFGASSVALFGEPGTGKFELVLTGRHCTRRCDGDSVEGVAFGGPIFYGHAAGGFNEKADHAGNAYWFQAQRANGVYQMLDGKQRERALLDKAREEDGEDTVKLSGKKNGLDGIRVGDLSKDQQAEVHAVLRDLLAPFRQQDADEAMRLIKASGTENLHMAFYKSGDIGNDGVWDVWQVEGPDMIWYFRGSPHVHVWANIRAAG